MLNHCLGGIVLGLTSKSTGMSVLNNINIQLAENELVIALAGNPNVGKSTVFNSLTGLNQHTGNWPGKTVTNAYGKYKHKDKSFLLVDLPGTYSLMPSSVEEEVARDFICFGKSDAVVIVTDATCLERNLNLVLQVLEITNKVIVCVNLLDEAKRKRIQLNLSNLSKRLGVPVIGTSARNGEGLKELMDAVYNVANNIIIPKPINITYNTIIENMIGIIEERVNELTMGQINSRWVSIKLIEDDNSFISILNNYLKFNIIEDKILQDKIKLANAILNDNGIKIGGLRDELVKNIVHLSEKICKEVVIYKDEGHNRLDYKIDNILTSKVFGYPIMIGILGIVFWITIQGANYPSELIAKFLFGIEHQLSDFVLAAGLPVWFDGIFIKGMFRTLAWVVSVMLPPMAIFFPLFTLLEDLGYLPRIAFNLDNFFKKACAHGKQALTMCMGFGCNAAGVIGCRIIDSPRERLIATITNNFVPCNGRFPTLIAISTIFVSWSFIGPFQSLISVIILLVVILIGIFMTLLVSKALSKTILKGVPSSFTLELPPYRKPQIGRIIVRSIFDRTIFVLGRAVCVAAPAGIVIWLMANVTIADISILSYTASFLQPFAYLIGLDGYILTAFILGIPANEIILPLIIMSYMANGTMLELDNLDSLRQLLTYHGWTWLTGVCVMLFSLMHWPCATTLWTIKKETQSWKWTGISFLVPTIIGIVICFLVAQTARILGLV